MFASRVDKLYTVRYNTGMDNRTALLHCALEMFASKGYEAVGVQEIVDAVHVTKPTLYHYFGSKQGLLQSLLDEYGGRLNDAVRAASDYQGDLTGSLTKLAGTYFQFAHENPTYYRMQLAMWFAPVESEPFQLVSSLNERQHGMVENMFEAAAKDHGNMRGRHTLYAAAFIGQIHTCIGLWLNGYADLNDELVYRVVHQFEHGIYS